MNNQITYTDKVPLNVNPDIPDINKVNASDMNEIKTKHNGCMNGSIPMGNIRVDSIQSKNLFNKNNVFIGIIYANGSIGSNETAYRYTEYIPITKNKITLSGINTSGGGNIIEYNSNKEKIDNWSTSNRTLTLNSNTKFIRFSLSSNDLDTAQLEYGESATPYSPYQNLTGEEVYSTSEMRIGTWINGKPLYRRVIVGTNINVDNTQTTLITIPNISECFIENASVINTSTGYTIAMLGYNPDNTTQGYRVWVDANSGYVKYQIKNAASGVDKIRIILYYTKTTD